MYTPLSRCNTFAVMGALLSVRGRAVVEHFRAPRTVRRGSRMSSIVSRVGFSLALCASLFASSVCNSQPAAAPPSPLLKRGQPVDWWFMFKLNASKFPNCNAREVCPFGGEPQDYAYGLQFVYASSSNGSLVKGSGCAGESVSDPLGATYDELYNGNYNYVVWNDQFYDNPHLDCADPEGNCQIPWGHSKGMVAWDVYGNGVVLQVTTPDWPGAGSAAHPREGMPGEKGDGNTLGCVGDNNVKFSQHFFALRLSKEDVAKVLRALANASVATSNAGHLIDDQNGPDELKELADSLGRLSNSETPTMQTLSSGVVLISKPSALHVAPWQMVSSLLGGVPLRAATWWGKPNAIPTTTRSARPACWGNGLPTAPGPVAIATDGTWNHVSFSLKQGSNHAKIGISTARDTPYAIFADMNQQGALSGSCDVRQNARGGLFFVVRNVTLRRDIAQLITPEVVATRADSTARRTTTRGRRTVANHTAHRQ